KPRIKCRDTKGSEQNSERTYPRGDDGQSDAFERFEHLYVAHQLLDAVPCRVKQQRLNVNPIDWVIHQALNELPGVLNRLAPRCDLREHRSRFDGSVSVRVARGLQQSLV